MKKEILVIPATIILVGIMTGGLVYVIGTVFTDIYYQNKTMEKSSEKRIDIDVQKRNECLENGFDYEFVKEFFYVGIRCKKME